MVANRIGAQVIFGATGDLAKLETFPALEGLVQRGVPGIPVMGVAKIETLREVHTQLDAGTMQGA